MSQAGDTDTTKPGMPTIFTANTVENGGSTSAEQISPNEEALGLLSNAAVQEIPASPVLSNREATVITPRADGKGGVIDLSAIRRAEQIQSMQAQLLESIAQPSDEEPREVAHEQTSQAPAVAESTSVQAQIAAKTAEIREMKRQTVLAAPQSQETSIPEPQSPSKILEFAQAIRRLLPEARKPVDLYNERQVKKTA